MRVSPRTLSGFALAFAVVVLPASAQSIFLTPVPNAPFTAVFEVQRTRIFPDASVLNQKSLRTLARDGRGRIHNESRHFLPANSTDTPKISHIHLYDPQTRVSTELDASKQTYYTQIIHHPPSTVPPTVRYGSPAGSVPRNDFSNEEDLGSEEIAGVQARGVRETQTIPAETSETGKEIVITDEYWYSDELRINVLMKHSDPRIIITTIKLTQITRGEPDPALLEIPEGYKQLNKR